MNRNTSNGIRDLFRATPGKKVSGKQSVAVIDNDSSDSSYTGQGLVSTPFGLATTKRKDGSYINHDIDAAIIDCTSETSRFVPSLSTLKQYQQRAVAYDTRVPALAQKRSADDHDLEDYRKTSPKRQDGRDSVRHKPVTPLDHSRNTESTREFRNEETRNHPPTSPHTRIDIVILDDDSATEDDGTDTEIELVGARKIENRTKRRLIDPRRNVFTLDSLTAAHNGLKLKPGMFVELRDGSFMRLSTLYRDRDGYSMAGELFVRADTFGPKILTQRRLTEWESNQTHEADTRLPQYYRGSKLLNEVVQKIVTVSNAYQGDFGLWQRPVKQALRERKLILCNQSYSDDNCSTEESVIAQGFEVQEYEEQGSVVCRWTDTTTYDQNGKWKEQSLLRPAIKTARKKWTDDSEALRKTWRSDTTPLRPDEPILFADGFCGAGGVSAGASQAGLTVSLAFDSDSLKISTHKKNNPYCESIVKDASDFVKFARDRKYRVDVLHLSPPCQPFSSANTRPNQAKDEKNQAPIFALGPIIEALRPRIVTVEEAPGIIQRHHPWFYALLNQFTDLSFTLCWSQLKCADFGVPQLRRRFILVAAAPGEDLPPFPELTHEAGSVSIQTVLREVEAAHARRPLQNHDKSLTLPRAKPAYNPNTLAKTITCGGGESYHPSGLRNFTPRELACLQTFPVRYKFGTDPYGRPLTLTELRTQIGNAVPPLVAKALFTTIVKSLRECDRKRRTDQAREQARQGIEVIALD